MSKYRTWTELCDRWGIKIIEVFDYLKMGLRIFSDLGDPEFCPKEYHEYYILKKEWRRISNHIRNRETHSDGHVYGNDILPALTDEELSKVKLKEKVWTTEMTEEKLSGIKKRMSVIEADDPKCNSWIYLVMPEVYGYRRELLSKYKNCLFLIEEVIDFEKNHNIKPIQTNECLKNSKGANAYKKYVRPSATIHKPEVRRIAAEIWEKDEKTTIADMCRTPEIKTVAKKKNGKPYKERTIRNWIKDLAPDSSPGRRPKKTNSH